MGTAIYILACLVLLNLQDVTGSNNEYKVFLTTGDESKKLSLESPLTAVNYESGYNLWVDRRKERQTMEGFGAALTNSAAHAIYHSPAKSKVLQDLFGQDENDLGISYLRIAMGGSDFNAVPTYTYDDIGQGQTDFNLEQFSIQKDKEFFIPVIQEALRINPNLKILATPWSAPAWMKTSGSLNGGEFINDSRYMQTYAMYFLKFIEAYASEGIHISAITCQNEPLHTSYDYPTMKMNADVQKSFIRDHLGPLFRCRDISTKILVFDHNWSDSWYPESVLNDETCGGLKHYVSGVAWHGYDGNHAEPSNFHNKYPDIVLSCLVALYVQHVAGFLLNGNNEYEVFLTTGDQSKKLSHESPVRAVNNENGYNLWVDRRKRRQTMEGFGAALTNSAAHAIYHSPAKSKVLQDLFGSGTDELGISYLRIAMGGSDFNAVPTYTYDDIGQGQTDFNLQQFSIQKDKEFFIPVIQEALRINPNLKILATPWSAPAWMKTSGSLNGGEFINDSRYMQTYAMYFLKFIEAYASEGIHITAITCQNEPLLSRNYYPTMKMSVDVQKSFIRDHLGPTFRHRNINTKIIVFDHNWSDAWYPESEVSDANVKQYISGVAWHGYGGNHDQPGKFHTSHPDVPSYFTEITGGDWDTNFASGLTWDNRIITIGQTTNWATAVFFFNVVLDENHGPRISGLGGCGDCRGLITLPSGSQTYTRNVEYYALGHLSKFVKPGAVRLETNTFGWDDIHAVAFANPDGTTVIVVANPSGNQQRTFSLNIDAQHFVYHNLPPNSVVTLAK